MHEIQRKILEYAKEEQISGKTLREIGFAVGESHPQKVKHHLEQLINKGFLQFDEEGNLYVVQKDNRAEETFLKAVPILRSASAGPATVFAEENIEGYLRISKQLLPKNNELFAVRVSGKSLNRASIKGSSVDDGDYLVIDPEDKDIKNGDYVLSVIDGLANVKKYFYDSNSNQVTLVSESSFNIPPIVIDPNVDNYLINGKVVRVVRNPKS